MRVWYYNMLGGERAAVSISTDRFTVGRGDHNQVVLNSHSVADEALVITRRELDWQLETRGSNGCQSSSSRVERSYVAARTLY
jgi:hypothetical protein